MAELSYANILEARDAARRYGIKPIIVDRKPVYRFFFQDTPHNRYLWRCYKSLHRLNERRSRG